MSGGQGECRPPNISRLVAEIPRDLVGRSVWSQLILNRRKAGADQ